MILILHHNLLWHILTSQPFVLRNSIFKILVLILYQLITGIFPLNVRLCFLSNLPFLFKWRSIRLKWLGNYPLYLLYELQYLFYLIHYHFSKKIFKLLLKLDFFRVILSRFSNLISNLISNSTRSIKFIVNCFPNSISLSCISIL